MKFSCSVDIDLPRKRVLELWENPENLRHWQDGFISMEHISGLPGTVGAQTKMTYDIRGKQMVLTETIIKTNLPEAFYGTYEGEFGKNSMNNHFKAIEANKTRWEAEISYSQMNGFIMNMMARLMPGMFRKQTQKWLNQFKGFAESQPFT